MKIKSIPDWLSIISIVWFGSNAYLYLFYIGGPKPIYSYIIFLILTAIWFIYSGRFLHGLDQGLTLFLTWLGYYVVYGIFEYFIAAQDAVARQALITLIESVLLVIAFVLLFYDENRLHYNQITLMVLTLILVVINLYDFVNPIFTSVPSRGAGLYVNPNISGQFIAMAMIGGLAIVARRFRIVYLLFCWLGVLVTFSRGAWILWAVGVMSAGWQNLLGPKQNRFVSSMLGIIISLSLTLLIFSGGLGRIISGTSIEQFLDHDTKARLGIGASSLSGEAARERSGIIKNSLYAGFKAPIIGHGLGYTTEWKFPIGPHNMYLLFFVEGGFIGLCLYLSLMFILWNSGIGIGRILSIQFIVAGFFTHNQLEQPVFLILFAFIAAHGAVFCSKDIKSIKHN